MADSFPSDMGKLHTALQNSFGAIKRDMEELRTAHEALISTNNELADALEKAKADSVTPDQLDVLAIKVNETAEEAKRLERVEKKLDAASEKFNERFVSNANFNKKVDKLQKKVDGFESSSKDHLWKSDFNTFVDELNEELAKLRAQVEKMEGDGGRVVDMRLEDLRREIQSERSDLEKSESRFEKKTGGYVKASSMERALGDVNKEFDVVKDQLDAVRREIKLVAAGLSYSKQQYAKQKSRTQPSKVMGSKTIFDDDDLDMEVIKGDGSPSATKRRRMLFVGNAFIFMAFASLAVSVALTFFNKSPWDSYTLWGGGIGFMMLGTILRIAAIVRGQGEGSSA